MPLIQCPDCGKGISDASPACINCGRPMQTNDFKPTENLPADLIQNTTASKFSNNRIKVLLPILFFALLAYWQTLQVEPKQKKTPPLIKRSEAVNQSFPIEDKTIVVKPKPPEKQKKAIGTINGYDADSGTVINPINIFQSYENRNAGLAGKARHGESVTILEKSGNGVKIKTSSGVTGWVSKWFVKES